MQYMVIERFHDTRTVYERLAARGRSMPAGLVRRESWVSDDLTRCFQLMETEAPRFFDVWIACRKDLMDFEIVPIISSAEASGRALAG